MSELTQHRDNCSKSGPNHAHSQKTTSEHFVVQFAARKGQSSMGSRSKFGLATMKAFAPSAVLSDWHN